MLILLTPLASINLFSFFFCCCCPFFSLQTLINSVYSCLIILTYLRGTFWSLINYCTGIFFSCIFEQSLFAAILATSRSFHFSFVGLVNSCAWVKIIKISLLFFHTEEPFLELRSARSGLDWKGTYITPACLLSHILRFRAMVPVLSRWRSAGLSWHEDPQGWAALGDGT